MLKHEKGVPKCHPAKRLYTVLDDLCRACYLKRRYHTDEVYRLSRIAYSRKYRRENPEKHAAYNNRWYHEHREYARTKGREARAANGKYWNRLRQVKRYGITVEQFDSMLSRQAGACALCERQDHDKTMHVDHDHRTGKIRALLCIRCNRALGLFGDDIQLLKLAIAYLKRHI